MSEYIERGALLTSQLWGGLTMEHDKARAKEIILCQPAADVVEVKHGRWEWREEWETHPEMRSCDLISCGWYCTECGIELGEYLTQKTGQHIILDDDSCKPRLMNCPNCGAKMDGE